MPQRRGVGEPLSTCGPGQEKDGLLLGPYERDCRAHWVEPGDPGVYGADPPTALPGFPSRDELIARYASATGADLSNLAYYRAFNSFKTACILHGVYARYMAGQKSTEGVDLPMLFARIGLSLDNAEALSADID